MSKYNIGDQVRIINHRGEGWNTFGMMDKFMGKVLTIMDVEEYPEADDSLYTMEECPMFVFSNSDIVELVSSPADIKPTEPKSDKPEFKVGMKVRIKGDEEDRTMRLDGKIGVILEVCEGDCLVAVETVTSPFGGWMVWNKNMTPVEETESTDTTTTTNNTKEENDMNTTETKKVAMADAPLAFQIELAEITAEFTDKVLKLADKYNVDRREVMKLAAHAVNKTANDEFFWSVVVPMQEAANKARERACK